jgi:hypothetical protein
MRRVETITKAAFARELGISKPRVTQLIQMGLPELPNGRLDRGIALQWYADNIIPPMLKNGEPNPTLDVLGL